MQPIYRVKPITDQQPTQIDRNRRRCAILLANIIMTPKKRRKKELAARSEFWHNQIRMAQAVAAKRQTAGV